MVNYIIGENISTGQKKNRVEVEKYEDEELLQLKQLLTELYLPVQLWISSVLDLRQENFLVHAAQYHSVKLNAISDSQLHSTQQVNYRDTADRQTYSATASQRAQSVVRDTITRGKRETQIRGRHNVNTLNSGIELMQSQTKVQI